MRCFLLCCKAARNPQFFLSLCAVYYDISILHGLVTPSLISMSQQSHCLYLLQFYISIAAMVGLSIAAAVLIAPPHLPDLFPVLISTTAFLHFLGTFIHFNVVQFSEPPSRKSQKKSN